MERKESLHICYKNNMKLNWVNVLQFQLRGLEMVLKRNLRQERALDLTRPTLVFFVFKLV